MTPEKWTAADIPDQSGRTAVVTGANSGLGAVTARELARAGAHVVLACRDLGRGEAVAGRIRGEAPATHVEVMHLDLAVLGSVRSFAEEIAERGGGLDLLVNNAGVMALPRRETADGFEMQLGINHLGHFALTGRLLPALLRTDEPRVVTISSGAHHFGRIAFGNLQGRRRYFRWAAYGQSKLANLLFAYELQRRAQAAGSPLRSMAAHPGYAATNLQLAGPRLEGSRVRERLGALGNRLIAQDEETGALPSLYAATVPDLPGGSYVGPDGLLEQRGHPKLVGSNPRAKDQEASRRLWEVSEELTGVRLELGPR